MISKFDFYLCSLACWTQHPGYQREGAKIPSLESLAQRAEALLKISEEYEKKWPSSQV